MKNNVRGVLMLLMFVVATSLLGQASTQEFPVPGHGALTLMFPSSWVQHARDGENGKPPTIEIAEPAGKVKVLITPTWSATNDPQFNSPATIQAAIEKAAHDARGAVSDADVPVRELNAKRGRGYYFWIQNPAPKPGEYEYRAVGAVPAGPLLVSFEILSHEAPPKGFAIGLVIVGTSSQISTSW